MTTVHRDTIDSSVTIMLKKITYYYLYKVCWFYKEKLKADHSYYYAVLWFFSAVNFIVLTLTTLALMALVIEWNSNWVRGISAVIILSGFPLTKSYNYQELVEKYKYEKHRSLKASVSVYDWDFHHLDEDVLDIQ